MTTLSWASRISLGLCLALGVAGCGGGDDTGDDANDSAPTGTDPTPGTSGATADDDATGDATAVTVDPSADDDGSSGITTMDSSGDGSQTMTGGMTMTSGMTMTTTMDTGESSTGGGGLEACTESDPLCGDGEMCRASMCCKDAGFCVFAAAPVCGGLVGSPCPEGLVCVLDQCVADADGRCVDADVATEIQETQPGCWTAG